MKKIWILGILVLLLAGCSERMTKQFIVSKHNQNSHAKVFENWTINPPNLIAFKNKPLEKFPENPHLFWLTIRAFTDKKTDFNNTLVIDSVGIELVGLDSTIWRTPSRVAPFEKSNKNYLAFDFFRDEGIELLGAEPKIRIFFDAVIVDTIKDSRSTHKVSFLMIRDETSELTPFLIQ